MENAQFIELKQSIRTICYCQLLVLFGFLIGVSMLDYVAFLKIFVTFSNTFHFVQKFVDFVASSFTSPQNQADYGNQLKGIPPFSALIYPSLMSKKEQIDFHMYIKCMLYAATL